MNGNTNSSFYVGILQSDIPAISDIDNDGDLDILAFGSGSSSSCVSYYKNLSQELQGNSNLLYYELVNICYGNFTESNASNTINLNSCCIHQVDNPEFLLNQRPNQLSSDRHEGSTLLSLDLDNDGMEELIIGDFSFGNLVRLKNDGDIPNTNVNLIDPDYAFPSYDQPVDMSIYPGAYHVDINNDNKKDLVVAPNKHVNANNYKANWLYLNEGTGSNPDFNLQTKGFLQDDMIDGGSESYPVYFDHNGDGLEDLIVAIADRFDSISTNGYAQLLYYENTGTLSNPEFTLIDEDYGEFANFNNQMHYFYRPTFGDADGDGDKDLLLSDDSDTMYYFENISGVGAIAQFVNATPLKNSLGQVINTTGNRTPKFVDLNRDGKADLVIGKQNGKLTYYENIGGPTPYSYSFEFKTDELGGVDVSEYWTNEGFATPEFVDIDNEYHLICGAENGFLHYYNHIDSNLTGNFNLVDSTLHKINIGEKSTPAILDIDGDNRLKMLVGNQRGGLAFYKSATVTDVSIKENIMLSQLNIYPNPTSEILYIDLSQISLNHSMNTFTLSDISGKNIRSGNITGVTTALDCKDLSKGLYLLTVRIDTQQVSTKIVID